MPLHRRAPDGAPVYGRDGYRYNCGPGRRSVISKWRWLLLQFTRKLWVRAAAFGVIAVVTALVGRWRGRQTPIRPAQRNRRRRGRWHPAHTRLEDARSDDLLAQCDGGRYSAATNNVSPRAMKLLMEDPTTQNVRATFIGSFLFSLALSTGTARVGGSFVRGNHRRHRDDAAVDCFERYSSLAP